MTFETERTNIRQRGGERWERPSFCTGFVKVKDVAYDDNCTSHGRQSGGGRLERPSFC